LVANKNYERASSMQTQIAGSKRPRAFPEDTDWARSKVDCRQTGDNVTDIESAETKDADWW
jgi:hypothetical protein